MSHQSLHFAEFAEKCKELGVELVTGKEKTISQKLTSQVQRSEFVIFAGLPPAISDRFFALSGNKCREANKANLSTIASAQTCITYSTDLIAGSGSAVIVTNTLEERQATSLAPELIVFCRNPKVHHNVSDFLAAGRARLSPGTTLTIVSGPSRTADIEQILIKGVHGPKIVSVYVEEGAEN
jgi:L-lactate dehydrogenase complex protein LldG